MAMSGASFGLYTGFLFFTLPQALAARHTVETTITTVTAIASSPGFFIFVISPMLDVRHSRRAYALWFTVLSALMLWISVMSLGHILALELAVTTGMAAICLASNGALLGWLSTVSPKEDENRLSAWLTVSNIAGGGVMAVLGGAIVRRLASAEAALVLAAMTLVPLMIYPWIPAPGPDRKLASESFGRFWRDVFALLRRREVLVALALFIAPCGTFSLNGMLGGIGNDFHASPRFVNLMGGMGVVVAGIFGSLLLPPLAKLMPLRPLYLTVGVVGSLLTLALIPLPRTAATFAFAMLGEQVFQSVAIACTITVCFETIGQRNPLAATKTTEPPGLSKTEPCDPSRRRFRLAAVSIRRPDGWFI
jgi:PAT family beta-lactamase induction signal transducer AmpG